MTGEEQLLFFWHNAGKYGHVEVMKWAFFNEGAHVSGVMEAAVIKTCINGAKSGLLDTIKYLIAKCCPWNDWTCLFAANMGITPSSYGQRDGFPWDEDTCAATNDHLSCFQWLRKNGCTWNEKSLCPCCLSCLRWARENSRPCHHKRQDRNRVFAETYYKDMKHF